MPYPAGQGSDIFARRFAEHFQRRFGHPFVVENRPGAGGNIGSAAVARAEPNGHTLLWGTNATHAANEFLYASLGFDPVRDFEPVAGILRLGMVLAVARHLRQPFAGGPPRARARAPGPGLGRRAEHHGAGGVGDVAADGRPTSRRSPTPAAARR